MQCKSGTISLEEKSRKTGEDIFDFGIIPHEDKINNYCSNEVFRHPNGCTDTFEKLYARQLRATLENKCIGKSSCFIKNPVRSRAKSRIENYDECFREDNVLFIQAACVLSNEELQYRDYLESALVSWAVFVTLFLYCYIEFSRKVQELDYNIVDYNTVTTADYSV